MQTGNDGMRPHPRLGWLAALVPAGARRFRALDPEFAAAVIAAGGELVDSSPDVEIGDPGELVGDANIAIIPVGVQQPRVSRRRPIRAAHRFVDGAFVRGRIRAARRAARRRGYVQSFPVAWEAQTKLVPTLDSAPERVPLFQRLPRRTMVVCRRRLHETTALEAALADASRELGRTLDTSEFALSSSGALIAAIEDVVLRVSFGPVAGRLDDQRAALEALREAEPGDLVERRVPWVLAAGRNGLAGWSVERRLPGRVARDTLGVTGDCLEFLAELFLSKSDGETPASPARDAEICAVHFPEQAETLRRLGSRLENSLKGVQRGFAHGDFWVGNLLLEDGRLVGVVDWPSAGPGRLPLLDLFQLRANQLRERTGARLASVLTEYLLPEAARGGHELDRAYCRRVGLELSVSDIESLLGAFWLDELRHALIDSDRDPVEPTRAEWRRVNIQALAVLARTCGLHELAESER